MDISEIRLLWKMPQKKIRKSWIVLLILGAGVRFSPTHPPNRNYSSRELCKILPGFKSSTVKDIKFYTCLNSNVFLFSKNIQKQVSSWKKFSCFGKMKFFAGFQTLFGQVEEVKSVVSLCFSTRWRLFLKNDFFSVELVAHKLWNDFKIPWMKILGAFCFGV